MTDEGSVPEMRIWSLSNLIRFKMVYTSKKKSLFELISTFYEEGKILPNISSSDLPYFHSNNTLLFFISEVDIDNETILYQKNKLSISDGNITWQYTVQ